MVKNAQVIALLSLISAFLQKKKDAAAFKEEYFLAWRQARDADSLASEGEKINEGLNRIFTALDSYCEDEELRDSNDLDETQLFHEISAIAVQLNLRE